MTNKLDGEASTPGGQEGEDGRCARGRDGGDKMYVDVISLLFLKTNNNRRRRARGQFRAAGEANRAPSPAHIAPFATSKRLLFSLISGGGEVSDPMTWIIVTVAWPHDASRGSRASRAAERRPERWRGDRHGVFFGPRRVALTRGVCTSLARLEMFCRRRIWSLKDLVSSPLKSNRRLRFSRRAGGGRGEAPRQWPRRRRRRLTVASGVRGDAMTARGGGP